MFPPSPGSALAGPWELSRYGVGWGDFGEGSTRQETSAIFAGTGEESRASGAVLLPRGPRTARIPPPTAPRRWWGTPKPFSSPPRSRPSCSSPPPVSLQAQHLRYRPGPLHARLGGETMEVVPARGRVGMPTVNASGSPRNCCGKWEGRRKMDLTSRPRRTTSILNLREAFRWLGNPRVGR
jgi:hypothetical protein